MNTTIVEQIIRLVPAVAAMAVFTVFTVLKIMKDYAPFMLTPRSHVGSGVGLTSQLRSFVPKKVMM